MASSPPPTTTAWMRLVHSSTLLGYGLSLSFTMIPFLSALNQIQWTSTERDGVPRLRNWAVLNGILLPSMLGACVMSTSVRFIKGEGRRFYSVPLALGCVMVPLFYGVQAAFIAAGYDTKYSGVDVIFLILFMFTYFILDVIIRSKAKQGGNRPRKKQTQRGRVAAPGAESKKPRPHWVHTLIRITPVLTALVVAFGYPFLVVPLFFSSGSSTRLVICLVLHPLLLEASEAVARSGRLKGIATKVEAGEMSLESAKEKVLHSCVPAIYLKQLMAFFRRFMLLNMGSPDATLAAVAVAAVEEVFSRGFLVAIDTNFRRLRGDPELEGDGLKLQRVVWMSDANQSCIAEFNAIFTASFAQILLQRHAVVIAVGYEPNKAFDPASVLVQMLVEVALEMLVDNAALWTEAENGIPITAYFAKMKSLWIFVLHAMSSLIFLGNVLFSYLRHPHIFSCGSRDACECVELPMFAPWLGEACASSSKNQSSPLWNVTSDDEEFFARVDFSAVLVSFMSGIAVLMLIVVAVLTGRYRKRKQTVAALKSQISNNEIIIEAKDRAIQDMAEKIKSSNKIVERVMREGGSAIDAYELKSADIDYGEVKRVLGEGAFGTVFHAAFRTTHEVAVKTMRIGKINESELHKFKSEIVVGVLSCQIGAVQREVLLTPNCSSHSQQIMAPLHHSNLVRLYGGVWNEGADKLCIVLEFCANGTLHSFVLGDKGKLYSWSNELGAFALGIAQGLSYLHHELKEPLIHRDVKPDNILVSVDEIMKLADFGESTRFDVERARIDSERGEDLALTMTAVGTQLYCAPEVVLGERYNESVDTFSFSLVLLCLVVEDITHVLKAYRSSSSMLGYVDGWRPTIPAKRAQTNEDAVVLIQSMWQSDFGLRPAMKDVVKALQSIADTSSSRVGATSARAASMSGRTEGREAGTPTGVANVVATEGESSASASDTIKSEALDAPSEYIEEKRRRAEALYRALSREDLELRLLESEASREEMSRTLREAQERMKEMERSMFQSETALRQQTTSNDKGITLRVAFEYDPDQKRSVLGEGAFGKVYAVKSTLDGKSYAMKRLASLKNADGSIDSVAMNELLQEVQKLSRVQSEYFVQYVTSSLLSQGLFVVMERLHGVEFRDLVVARKALNIPFHEHQIERWLEQLAMGLAYLHDEVKLVHQDLHNGNVMVTWDPTEEAAEAGTVAADDELLSTSTRVKILDLGLSSFKSEQTTRTMHAKTMRTMRSARTGRRNSFVEMAAPEVCGFKAIRAPEMWATGQDNLVRFDAKVDVWALGLLMSEAVLCNPIEEWYEDRATLLSFGKDRGLQETKIAEVSSISTHIGGLIGQMLAKEPRFRLAAREVVQDMKSQNVSIFPPVEERFFCQACSVSEWLSGLGFKSHDDLVAWRQRQMRDTMNTFADRSPFWKDFNHVSIPSNVRCEWRTTKETNARLYRITIPLECTDATLAWMASVKSFGTSRFFNGGDRSMENYRVLQILDGSSIDDANSFISFQVMRLPRPLPRRRFSVVTHVNKEALLLANYPFPLPCEDLVGSSVSDDVLRGTLPGKVFHYSSKFEVGPDKVVRIVMLGQHDVSTGESRYHGLLRRAANFSVDRVAVAAVKCCRGIARRVDELVDLLHRETRLNSALDSVKAST